MSASGGIWEIPEPGRVWMAPVGTPPPNVLPTYRVPPGVARVNGRVIETTTAGPTWRDIGHIVDTRAERIIRRDACARGRTFAEQAELYLHHIERIESDRRMAEHTYSAYPVRVLLGFDGSTTPNLVPALNPDNRKAPTMGNFTSCTSLSCLYGVCRCRRTVEVSFGSRGIVRGARVRVEHRRRDEFAEFTVERVIVGDRGGVVAVKPGETGRGYKATDYKLTVLAAPLPTAEGLYVVKGIRDVRGASVYALTGGTWRKWDTDTSTAPILDAKRLALAVGVDGLVPLKAAA